MDINKKERLRLYQKLYQRKYREKNRKKIRTQQRLLYAKNNGREKKLLYRKANREHFREYHRKYNKTEKRKNYAKEYFLKNKESIYKKKSEWDKRYRERHKEKLKKIKQKWASEIRKTRRMQALNHYSNSNPKCACCGEQHWEFLQIDHINGGGNKHRKEIGHSNVLRWIIKNNFPEGFRVLCSNCNFSLGIRGYCPHNQLKKE